MAIQLNSNQDCCESSCTNTTVNVPGPEGAAGADGTNGTNGVDGVNAYSTTTAAHTVPNVGSIFNMYVADHAAFSVNQILVISGFGHYLITHKGTDGGGGEYLGAKRLGYPNDTGSTGATIAIGTEVSPAGPQGPAGATGEASALLTSKGQLITRTSAAPAAISASGNGTALFTNTALNTGLEWKAINFTDVSGTINSAQTAVGSLPLDRLTAPSDEEGDLAYHNGTSWARLPHGSNGQVLTVSGGVPTWVSAVNSGLSVVAEGDITFEYQSGTPQIDSVSISNAVNLSSPTCFAGNIASSVTITFDTAIGNARPVVIFTDTSSGVNTSGWKVTATSATAITINTGITSNVSNMSFRVQVLA